MASATETARDAYVAALIARDGHRARAIADAAGDPCRIALEVLAPAMQTIGDLWEAGELSVADEHYATGVTEGIMAVLAERLRRPPAGGRLAVVCCPPGERHGLGARMLADLLEAEGWEALLLGADTPVRDLIALVRAEQPDVVAVSVSMVASLDAADEIVGALSVLDPAPHVVVGGRARRDAPPLDWLVADLCERFPPLPD